MLSRPSWSYFSMYFATADASSRASETRECYPAPAFKLSSAPQTLICCSVTARLGKNYEKKSRPP